jgi:hypothetical protein
VWTAIRKLYEHTASGVPDSLLRRAVGEHFELAVIAKVNRFQGKGLQK